MNRTVYQYCNKCKDEKVHILEKKELTCMKCDYKTEIK